jgi:hypothetical protein
MRCFDLVRHADPSGVSGTGVVAHGVQFADGVVALRWACARPATSIWDSVDDLISVHGHGGRTIVRWIDDGCRADVDPPHGCESVATNDRRSSWVSGSVE